MCLVSVYTSKLDIPLPSLLVVLRQLYLRVGGVGQPGIWGAAFMAKKTSFHAETGEGLSPRLAVMWVS